MMKRILYNISQLATCHSDNAKSGKAMLDAGLIDNAYIVIHDDHIHQIGSMHDIDLRQFADYNRMDCEGKAVLPGFIDSHTHFVFGGYRDQEFSQRLNGESYMEILQQGGGIQSTVHHTRAITEADLIEIGRKRLDRMLSMGVTTVEGKSGYGLDLTNEIKQLRVMKVLQQQHVMDVIPTFMGAHAIPQEYKGRGDDFIQRMIHDVLPVVCQENLAVFADIFCEKGVFSIDQSRQYLLAAKENGLIPKIHADEIVSLGGAELAVELTAASADHLLHATPEGIHQLAHSNTVATLLPATAFSLREPYADARLMIDSGCAVALATDFNPGSCFTHSIPLIIALAAIQMSMRIEEIVNALTINAARALHIQDQVGSIAPGKKADILILEYPSIDFLAYYMGTNIIETVIKNGSIVHSNKEKIQ